MRVLKLPKKLIYIFLESMDNYRRVYDVPFLDDIHNFFPAFLYDQRIFLTPQDVFGYINRQMDTHFNIYTRARREYNQANPVINTSFPLRRPPPAQPQVRTATGSVIDILPLFNTTQQNNILSEYFLNAMLRENLIPSLEPVIVRPSQAQVDLSTTLRLATNEEEQNCSVCQEGYSEGQAIRTITYCSHRFHKNCIDNWFGRNVHCPDCRHDIRIPNSP
jgi:hypothetical protein